MKISLTRCWICSSTIRVLVPESGGLELARLPRGRSGARLLGTRHPAQAWRGIRAGHFRHRWDRGPTRSLAEVRKQLRQAGLRHLDARSLHPQGDVSDAAAV